MRDQLLKYNSLTKIKLIEIWKSLNIDDYPIKISRQEVDNNKINTRANHAGRPIEIGNKALTQKTCIADAIKLWNHAPLNLKECKSLQQIKSASKSYAKTLPF